MFLQWIGVNTEYLTVTGTSTVQVVVATATAAANGQSVGDISLILSEGLANALQDSVEAAITACNVLAKRGLELPTVLGERQTDSGKSEPPSKFLF